MSRERRGRRESREQQLDARRRAAAAARRVTWDRGAEETEAPGTDREDVVRVPDGERLRPAPAPESIGAALEAFVARRGWEERLRGVSLVDRWAEVVGDELAARSRPGRLRGTVLDIVVADARWSTQLKYLGPQLAGRVSAVLGRPVEHVRIVVGDITGPEG